MQFEYYVLNYDWNKKKVFHYNIFNNIYIQEWTEKAIKKYIRSPKNYTRPFNFTGDDIKYGFDALCDELRLIFMHEMWARREYEISVSDAFVYEIGDIDINKYNSLDDLKADIDKIKNRNPKLEKWDCFKELELNIPMIARECIYQYRQYIKENKKDGRKNE